MVTQKCFQKFWESNYGHIPPLGHILREEFFEDRWFRIHSLPNSKRYADNDDEMQIVLSRQNTIFNDLIGSGQGYLLLFYTISKTPESVRFNQISDITLLDNIRLDIALPENYDEECYFVSGFVNKKWEAASIDAYLEKIANDEMVVGFNACECDLYRILIIDINRNRIIAPYDGGVDMFLNTRDERDFFKSKYRMWLPAHELGL